MKLLKGPWKISFLTGDVVNEEGYIIHDTGESEEDKAISRAVAMLPELVSALESIYNNHYASNSIKITAGGALRRFQEAIK